LSGANAEVMAYQLERKLFDNGHAAVVITDSVQIEAAIHAIKQAGLIAITTMDTKADLTFKADSDTLDAMHLTLKEQTIIS
jgi:bifunctional enzyme CysN/CysC